LTTEYQGRELVIEDDGAKCAGGVNYAPNVTRCSRGENGRANCRGSNSSGDYDVRLRKLD
jgi:hypothetical protein